MALGDGRLRLINWQVVVDALKRCKKRAQCKYVPKKYAPKKPGAGDSMPPPLAQLPIYGRKGHILQCLNYTVESSTEIQALFPNFLEPHTNVKYPWSLVVLRDPVKRVISNYNHLKREATLDKAIAFHQGVGPLGVR